MRLCKQIVTDLLNLVYPPLCMCCGGFTNPDVPICLICAQSLDCPLPDEVLGHIRSLGSDAPISDAQALWIFEKDGPVQLIHRELKYGNRPYYGLILGQLLGRRLLATLSRNIDIIVPIPLHRTRLLERGYNQCRPLSDGIAHVTTAAVDEHSVIRNRRTRSQTSLSVRERRRNLSGAFSTTKGHSISGRHVLVVDDVITTGATVAEASALLTDAGAASVTVAAIGFARI